jgi:phosphoribosylglycinamide formyltransferase-1
MTNPRQLRLALLLSGSGTTLQNLLDLSGAGRLPGQIVCVLSSNHKAYGLNRAQHHGIPTVVVERQATRSRMDFSAALFHECREKQADLVLLAGFLHLLHIPADFANRVMNIHPSLIPAFCGKGFHGLHVHQAVLDAGVKITGCTAHFADNEYDHGPIILQSPVAVADDDDASSLAARVFAEECRVYPAAIQLFAEQRLQVQGRRVRILPW